MAATVHVGEASSSSSIQPPLRKSWKHHVFLSFRGEDTRTGFTSHLYAALTRKGITTFKDDYNLRTGDHISDELLKAIEDSMFAVIVISPNYASSPWCLDELCKILECKNKLGQRIVPVFYGVEPSDVRHQKGTFGEAFRKHETRFGEESDKVRRWRDALTQVAGYSGCCSTNQNEATLVDNISQRIHEILIPNLPSSMNKLVGIDSRVKQVIRHIGIGLNDVRYIGICGMGGIGKTTIARIVYEAIQSEFEVAYFLAHVRETCEKHGIVQAQKELVGNINGSSNFNNEYDGSRIIRASLCHKKVLLVVDDIDKVEQLKNLAEEQDWFGAGSRIIITTRDMHLLKIYDAHEIYNVEGLTESEAFDLFCLKAFKQRKPAEEYLELSKLVVKYCAGLPLALEVLGCYLYDRTTEVWHSALAKLKSCPHVDIFGPLKISYDGLDSMDKEMFLDIAYFFKGCHRIHVINILKGCDYHVDIGIANLIDRSLLTINKDGYLEMHDLIEEMGTHIVIQESPNDPSKRSRLRSFEDIKFVLTKKKGRSKATRSIYLCKWETYQREDIMHWRDLTFSNICQLKLLVLDGMRAPILSYIPCSLKVLRWRGCPMETLPFMDKYYDLVEIDLHFTPYISHVWHGKKFLEKLKRLNLENCSGVKQIPDLSEAPNLESLTLTWARLIDFPSYLTSHKSLVKLKLSCCQHLSTLGSKLEMSSLQELHLHGCTKLRKLPEFGECMKHLSILTLGLTAIEELPTSVEYLVGLKKLCLCHCSSLTYLPDSIQKLKSLTSLNLSHCSNVFQSLHSLSSLTSLSTLRPTACFLTSQDSPSYNFANLVSLTDLYLSGNNFVRVPINIHELPRLRRLHLDNCPNLKVLPELPSSIRELYALVCESLDAWNLNVISKVCCGFAASANHSADGLLQMCVTQKEIPSWFVHLEQGNGVSVTFPHNEIMALVLCFRLCPQNNPNYSRDDVFPSVICNGKEFIKKSLNMTDFTLDSQHFIVCLTNDYFVDQVCQNYHFQLVLLPDRLEFEVHSSGAHWVCKQDIQDLKKSGTETSKRKATFDVNMNIIPPSPSSSPSKKKMLMVAHSSSLSPLEEEE